MILPDLIGRRALSRTPIPSAIGWSPEGGIQRKGIGASARAFMIPPASTTLRYVDRLAAGTGASKASPRGTLWQELNAITGPTTIYVKSSAVPFDLSNGSAGIPFVSSANLIAVDDFDTLAPGRITITMGAPLTWADATGGAYSSTMAGAYAFAPYAVIDEAVLDAYGAGAWLTPVADLAACQAAPSSWAKVGAVIYVHTATGRAPDANVHVMKDANGLSTVFAGDSVYVEGVTLIGGARCLWAPVGTRVTLARCKARYGRVGGFGLHNLTRSTVLDCQLAGNGADGIDYTDTVRALEVGTTSSHNGNPTIPPANIHNGSTFHGTGSIIRVGNVYLDNQGPNVADVLGAHSLNVRCRASGTIATDLGQQVGVWIDGVGYLDGCDITGNTLDLKAEGVGDQVVVYNTRYGTTGGDGVVRGGRGG